MSEAKPTVEEAFRELVLAKILSSQEYGYYEDKAPAISVNWFMRELIDKYKAAKEAER